MFSFVLCEVYSYTDENTELRDLNGPVLKFFLFVFFKRVVLLVLVLFFTLSVT